MNAHQHRGDEQPAEPKDGLPVPAISDLAADRFQILKEHLMAEIHTAEPRTSPARRARRAIPRLPLATGLAAAAAALGVLA
ncbi:hypothetical protein, partial [Nonomuraea lactucae]|uniref:hypothetical protein n=1 Tax=Nonomuraea lactucae TaxID=2249762 RepID=UPI0013B41AFF